MMNYEEKFSAEIDKIYGEIDSLKREIDRLNEINYKLINWINSFCLNYVNHNKNCSSKNKKKKGKKSK